MLVAIIPPRLMTYISRTLLFLVLYLMAYAGLASRVDTVSIYSPAMQREIQAVVVLPDAYFQGWERFPVVYLLHGYGGNYASWTKRVPDLPAMADAHKVIFVCPDGGFGSWYFDSPYDSTVQFETHIVHEVVPFVDRNFRTRTLREYRAIAGLSMGGHGALRLALRHPEVFAQAGSMSGGVDIKPFMDRWDLRRLIGHPDTQTMPWDDLTVVDMVGKYPTHALRLIIDCGTDDFFYPAHTQLHQKLRSLKVPHRYLERKGNHSWTYWAEAVTYQLAYFVEGFGG
jgi:S-formylglutathione hydrolase FrmB